MFEKTVIESTKGLQGSKWDEYYVQFDKPGVTLWAPIEKMSGQEASQFAARMRVVEAQLGGKRKFHSGVNKVTGRSFVRVRLDGEVPDKGDDQDEQQEQSELPVGDTSQGVHKFTE